MLTVVSESPLINHWKRLSVVKRRLLYLEELRYEQSALKSPANRISWKPKKNALILIIFNNLRQYFTFMEAFGDLTFKETGIGNIVKSTQKAKCTYILLDGYSSERSQLRWNCDRTRNRLSDLQIDCCLTKIFHGQFQRICMPGLDNSSITRTRQTAWPKPAHCVYFSENK